LNRKIKDKNQLIYLNFLKNKYYEYMDTLAERIEKQEKKSDLE
jgi:hypothetical protein